MQWREVRASLDWFRPCGPALMAQVLRQLSDHHPRVRGLFPDDASEWTARYFATLDQIVGKAHDFQTLETSVANLGRRVAARGAGVREMTIVRDELIEAMSRLAGDDWTPALQRDWLMLLDAVIGAMALGQASPVATRTAEPARSAA
jgi:hemoglobin-like flavoprotein